MTCDPDFCGAPLRTVPSTSAAMTRTVTGILSLIVLTSGCTALNVSRMFKPEIVADERHPVIDVMCLWEAAEGTGLDGMPCRGFRGQVLFFTAGQKSPAKVDGDIRIYVFDQNGPDGDPSKPIHQFDFPGLAWNTFLTETNFGNAYQIFIPYTKRGNEHADCQLRVRFMPNVGNTVHSRSCAVALPGTRPVGASAQRHSTPGPQRSGIQQASHEEVVGASPAPPRLLPGLTAEHVETIRLGDEARQRSQDLKVQKLRQLAADLASDEPAPAATQPTASSSTKGRSRLNPLAAETPAAPEPAASEPRAASAKAVGSQHPLLD